MRYSAAVTISATPALLSAPSSVVPGRGDDVVAELLGQRRDVAPAGARRRIVRQHEIASVVAAVHDRLDARAAHLRRRVDVGDEADRRARSACASSQGWSPSRSRIRRSPRRPGRAPAAPPPDRAAAPAACPCSDRWSTLRRTGCRIGRSEGSGRGRRSLLNMSVVGDWRSSGRLGGSGCLDERRDAAPARHRRCASRSIIHVMRNDDVAMPCDDDAGRVERAVPRRTSRTTR